MPRRRSNSLPIPKIEVSIYQSPESKKKDVLKDFIEVPDTRDTTLTAGTHSWRFLPSQDRSFLFFCVDLVTFLELSYAKLPKTNRDIRDAPARRRKSAWRWPISRPLWKQNFSRNQRKHLRRLVRKSPRCCSSR